MAPAALVALVDSAVAAVPGPVASDPLWPVALVVTAVLVVRQARVVPLVRVEPAALLGARVSAALVAVAGPVPPAVTVSLRVQPGTPGARVALAVSEGARESAALTVQAVTAVSAEPEESAAMAAFRAASVVSAEMGAPAALPVPVQGRPVSVVMAVTQAPAGKAATG